MTVRAGLVDYIRDLRNMTQAGTADYTINAVTYWSDEQIQTELIRFHKRVWYVPFNAVPTWTNGSVEYYTYTLKPHVSAPIFKNFEGTASGTAYWFVSDSNGNAPSLPYTADVVNGVIVFESNTGGTPYYLSSYYYNLYRTAASIWRAKAAYYAYEVNFESNDQKFFLKQRYDMAMDQARYYDSLAGPIPVAMQRTDLYET